MALFSYMSRDARKPVFGVSDQVPHKPVCAATEESYKLEILDIYPCSESKCADQLCSYCTADLHLCFHIKKSGFLMMQPKYDVVFFYSCFQY